MPESKAGRWINLNGLSLSEPFDVSGDQVVERIVISQTESNSIDVSGCTALTHLFADSNSATSINLTNCGALVRLGLPYNALVTIDIGDSPLLASVDLQDNLLTESAVDGVLADLDAAGLENGEVYLQGEENGGNAPPSAAGLTSKANLEGKGWTVTVNS